MRTMDVSFHLYLDPNEVKGLKFVHYLLTGFLLKGAKLLCIFKNPLKFNNIFSKKNGSKNPHQPQNCQQI
jgi:hypothetical protein